MTEGYTVCTNPVGDTLHVYPGRGLLGMSNWKMAIPFRRRRPIWLRSNYRLMYPRTERQLARSLRWCQAACDELNRQDERGHELQRLAGGAS